ncbi:hypothetical protein OAO01_03920 [Oligoflexia bacterium]|nr:hypothetical protein [Oligoflexia bacterium]
MEYFSEEIVNSITGEIKYFSGFYISTPYPKKVKKKQTFLQFAFCTQYSTSEPLVNALGHKSPSEGKIVFTNNLCSQPRAPFEISGLDCTDFFPPKQVGALLVSRYSATPPNAGTQASMFQKVEPVTHYIRPLTAKKPCQI